MEAFPTAISKYSNALQKLWLNRMRESKTFQIREIYNFVLVGEDILTHSSNSSASSNAKLHEPIKIGKKHDKPFSRSGYYLSHIVVGRDRQMSKLAILPSSITFLFL